MTRVELVLATTELIDAELKDPARLAAAMEAELAADWPPEHHDADAMSWQRAIAAHPASLGWGMYYVTVVEGGTRVIVGTCGYHGPPEGGVAEVGYSVVPSHQRRGIATAAVRQLVEWAWERGTTALRANTFPHLEPSIGMLRKLGFEQVGETSAEVISFELQKPP